MNPIDFEQGNCPACGVSWQGNEIPKESQELFGGDHFSRVIGVEYSIDVPQIYRYDGISEYRCPDCKARFSRWTGERLKDGEYAPRYGKEETSE